MGDISAHDNHIPLHQRTPAIYRGTTDALEGVSSPPTHIWAPRRAPFGEPPQMQLRVENAALGGTVHAVLEARAETLRGSSVETHRPSAPRCGWARGASHAPCAHRGPRSDGRRARGARRGTPAAHMRAEQNSAAGAPISLRPGSYLLLPHAARNPHRTPCPRSIAQTPRSHPQPPHSDLAHKPPLRAGVLEAERSGDNKRKCPQGMQEAVRVNIIALAADHFEPGGAHLWGGFRVRHTPASSAACWGRGTVWWFWPTAVC